MNYKEAVEKQISGDTHEQKQRRMLWEDIAAAYNKGGEDEVKTVLTAHVEKITKEFKKNLKQLDETIL